MYALEATNLPPGLVVPVRTGIAIAIPDGWQCCVRSRSGLASKGVIVINSPGTIDSGYRGEVKVLMLNENRITDYVIKAGDRIAQLSFERVFDAEFEQVSALPTSDRGTGGFGSTGL